MYWLVRIDTISSAVSVNLGNYQPIVSLHCLKRDMSVLVFWLVENLFLIR